tara:strand:- start:15 stop:674 length:660 start_codon:yes stop_codon:yes gene_type:complete
MYNTQEISSTLFEKDLILFIETQGFKWIGWDQAITDIIGLARKQVAQFQSEGIIPLGIKAFGELHDHIDANGLGNAFYFPMRDHEPSDEYLTLSSIFWNTVQDSVIPFVSAYQPIDDLIQSKITTQQTDIYDTLELSEDDKAELINLSDTIHSAENTEIPTDLSLALPKQEIEADNGELFIWSTDGVAEAKRTHATLMLLGRNPVTELTENGWVTTITA